MDLSVSHQCKGVASRIAFIVIAAIVLCFALVGVGCASSNPPEKIYVEDSDIPDVFANPNSYKGKYIVITGQVFNKVGTEGSTTTWQAHHDVKNYDDNFVFTASNNIAIATDDYVVVEGLITGAFEGTNAFGAKIINPLIQAESVEVLSYIDAVVPTQAVLKPQNATIDQYGMAITIDSIEFAEQETRLYITAANNSESTFNLYEFNTKIIQNGQQYDIDSASSSKYQGDYPSIASSILPGASSSGIIVFPAIDPNTPFQVVIEGHSNNSSIGHYGTLTYTFDIQGEAKSSETEAA